MKELLEELKTIDPACYDEIARGLGQVDIEYEEDIIQGACQRAVAAQKWEFRLGSAMMDESKKGFYCAIMHRVSSMWLDLVVSKEAASAAESILTAYIAARKAQP